MPVLQAAAAHSAAEHQRFLRDLQLQQVAPGGQEDTDTEMQVQEEEGAAGGPCCWCC